MSLKRSLIYKSKSSSLFLVDYLITFHEKIVFISISEIWAVFFCFVFLSLQKDINQVTPSLSSKNACSLCSSLAFWQASIQALQKILGWCNVYVTPLGTLITGSGQHLKQDRTQIPVRPFLLQLHCPIGISPIGNSGCFLRENHLRQNRSTEPTVHVGCF